MANQKAAALPFSWRNVTPAPFPSGDLNFVTGAPHSPFHILSKIKFPFAPPYSGIIFPPSPLFLLGGVGKTRVRKRKLRHRFFFPLRKILLAPSHFLFPLALGVWETKVVHSVFLELFILFPFFSRLLFPLCDLLVTPKGEKDVCSRLFALASPHRLVYMSILPRM